MSDFTPTQRTTDLEAVNAVLIALGREPLASLPSFGADALSDAVVNHLDNETRKVLKRGWHFNTEKKTYSPSSGTVTIDAVDLEFDAGDNNIAQVGAVLMHMDTGLTDDFTSDVTGWSVVARDFSDCPEVFRQYIIARAASAMAQSYAAEVEFIRRIEIEEAKAKRDLQSFERRTRNSGLLNQGDIHRRVGYRWRGYHSY